MWFTLFASFLAFSCICFKYRNRPVGTRLRPDLNGPKGLPIVGNLIMAIRRTSRGLEHCLQSTSIYGEGFTGAIPNIRFVDVSMRPDWLEHIQKTKFDNYVKGQKFSAANLDVLGGGIFNVDGIDWYRQRKVISRVFTPESFRNVITPALKKDIEALNLLMDRKTETSESFDLQDLFFRFTLQSFGRIAFGINLDSLSLEQKPVPFAEAFDFAQGVLLDRLLNPFWKFTELFSSNGRRMTKAVETISSFAYDIIDQRVASLEEDEKAEVCEKADLLAIYMGLKDNEGRSMDRSELRDFVVNLLIAGRDTTAQALSWAFFRLIHNPELRIPVLHEIETVLRDDEVTFDNLKSCVETQAVMQETLRLHPSIPKNLRMATSDDVLPNGGPIIHAGEFVRWCDWALGRNVAIWGEDATEFRPSRWIDEKGHLKQVSQWQQHAFNGGPRVCVGKQLAALEIVSVLVNLLRNYEIEFAPGWWGSVEKTEGILDTDEATPLYGPSLSLPMIHPFMVTAKKRISNTL